MSGDEGDDTDLDVTPEEVAAARERFKDHEPAVPELFSRPVYGNGVKGDVGVGTPPDDDAKPLENPPPEK